MGALIAIPHEIILDLPIPPSVNNAWFNIPNGGRANTKDYNEWIEDAGFYVRKAQIKPPQAAYYCLKLLLPYAMRGDIDNRVKPVLDLLVRHRITPDDRKAWSVYVRRDYHLAKDICRVLVSFYPDEKALISLQDDGFKPPVVKKERAQPLDPLKLFTKTERIDFILQNISIIFSVSLNQILGASRVKNVTQARRVAVYCIKFIGLPSLTYSQVGAIFSRDHSSCIHNCLCVERDIADKDEKTLRAVSFISQNFGVDLPEAMQ
jgi:Holliday junction resolvase RusA-like endonuclease